jgi:uncharacterized protein
MEYHAALHTVRENEMKTNLPAIRKKLAQLLPLLTAQYKIKSLALFGSYVRREQNHASDLDILVEYQEVPDLISYIELENSLSDLLGIKVDLVMKDGLKPRIAQSILAEAVQV